MNTQMNRCKKKYTNGYCFFSLSSNNSKNRKKKKKMEKRKACIKIKEKQKRRVGESGDKKTSDE